MSDVIRPGRYEEQHADPSVIAMHIEGPADQPIYDELSLVTSNVALAGAEVLELGCGGAQKTRAIAEQTDVARILAAEVDPIQHRKNLLLTDLPKVTFADFGAEAIAAPDGSFDVVMMFKSLHHVPVDMMDAALNEIARVLKPGGTAYISEPVFAGEFNEVIRLFHDESAVRRAAFAAEVKAVENGAFTLKRQIFFKNRLRMRSFSEFEEEILNATHTEHRVSPELLARVRERFEANASADGYAFLVPNRVDMLSRP